MSYQTLSFIAFSFAAIAVYYIAGFFSQKAKKYVLLASGTVFYIIAGAEYLPFITVTLLSSYFSAIAVSRLYIRRDISCSLDGVEPAVKKQIKEKTRKKAKAVMLCGILIPLLLLAVCKYTGFVMRNLNTAFSHLGFGQITVFKTVLPLGISFYTFMAVSYVLDVYWERYEAEKNFVSYAAFLTYFPHIVQGPIDRYNEFRDQLNTAVSRFPDTKQLAFGAELAIWGFFKKLVIADRLGAFVNTIYDNPGKYTGLIVVLATLFYSIQIYADFSGCIDIVSGVSEMFGIKLKKNFNHPYFSKDIPEFWRRWHISLGEWFKDYIYYPVSISAPVKKIKKNLRKKGKRKACDIIAACIPTAVVWAITGLWHGASWNYIAWGVYYAVIMVLGIIFKDTFKKINAMLRVDTESFSFKLFQMVRTFLLCAIGRIFFRSQGLRNALIIFASIFKKTDITNFIDGGIYGFGIDRANFALVIAAILVLLTVDILQEKMRLRESLSKQNIFFRWTLIFAGIFAVIIFGIYGADFDVGAFIYEQF